MATVDTLLVRIEADTRDLKRGLRKVERDVERTTNKASASFKKLGSAFKLIAAAVVVRQAAVAGAAMVNLASDIEEMEGKSKVVFGKFRNQVVEDLTAFGDAVGRSSHELEGMASSVQDTFVPMGFARGEASKLSVELTKLAVDTASFNNASDTDTMEAFKSALVGNHETVRRFGVVITEQVLKQELMNMGIKGGTKAATESEKVQARLALITRGVSDAHGDAARTSGSYANSMRGLKAEFSELTGELGTIFLPTLVKVINKLKDVTVRVKEFLQSLGVLDTPTASALSNTRQEIIETAKELEESQKLLIPKKKSDGTFYEKSINDSGVLRKKIKDLKNSLIDLDQRTRQLSQTNLTGNIEDTSTSSGSKTPKIPFEETPRGKQVTASKKLLKQLIRENDLQRQLHTAKMNRNKEDIEFSEASIKMQELQQQFPDMSPKNLNNLAEQYITNKVALDAYNEAQRLQNEGIQSGVSYVDSMLTEKEKLLELQRDLNEAHFHGAITTDELNAAHRRLADELLLLDPIYANLVDMSNQAFDKMSNDLADMAMSGKFNLDTLKDTFKNTMREMVREAIKTFIIKKMLQAMLGGIGGAIGGPAGNFIAKIGTSASGGSLSAGQPQIVGERGAELIVPKSASTVLNHHNTKNAIGGKSGTVVNQTINVDAGVSQTVRAEMLNLLPIIKQDTLNAVIDGQNRGGSFSKAFA
jgi:hypothetical protein